MAIGTVTKFNGMHGLLQRAANRQWDDAAAGNIMFCLATNVYTPDATDSLTSDLSGIITAGDGAPINATSLAVDDTTTPGKAYLDSADANFGAAVTITAKYLVAVQPETAGTFSATTSHLLWYVDLDDTTTSTSKTSTASEFNIVVPANGWLSFT